jgi:hypothetical protein
MTSRRLPEMARYVYQFRALKTEAESSLRNIGSFMILYDITSQKTVIFISLQFNNSTRKPGGTRSLLKAQRQKRVVSLISRPLYPLEKVPRTHLKEDRVKTREPVRSLRTTETSVPPA